MEALDKHHEPYLGRLFMQLASNFPASSACDQSSAKRSRADSAGLARRSQTMTAPSASATTPVSGPSQRASRRDTFEVCTSAGFS